MRNERRLPLWLSLIRVWVEAVMCAVFVVCCPTGEGCELRVGGGISASVWGRVGTAWSEA